MAYTLNHILFILPSNNTRQQPIVLEPMAPKHNFWQIFWRLPILLFIGKGAVVEWVPDNVILRLMFMFSLMSPAV